MKKQFTNSESYPQAVYDQWGNPHIADPGDTVEYEGDETIGDVLKLDTASVVSGGATYVGYAKPGTLKSAAAWAVCKIYTDGDGHDVKVWAGGVFKLQYIFNNFAALSYS